MTPLRQKLIDDLDLRSRADTTILAYVSACARLARYHRRSPEHLDLDHVRAFLLHLQRDCMASPANVKLHVAALRFLYGTTLERPDLALSSPKLAVIPSRGVECGHEPTTGHHCRRSRCSDGGLQELRWREAPRSGAPLGR